MNIEFDAYKQKLNDCRPALDGLADSLNLEGMRNELERLHAMQEAPGFWTTRRRARKSLSRPARPRARSSIMKKCCRTGTI